jgi:hypothetical protein
MHNLKKKGKMFYALIQFVQGFVTTYLRIVIQSDHLRSLSQWSHKRRILHGFMHRSESGIIASKICVILLLRPLTGSSFRSRLISKARAKLNERISD